MFHTYSYGHMSPERRIIPQSVRIRALVEDINSATTKGSGQKTGLRGIVNSVAFGLVFSRTFPTDAASIPLTSFLQHTRENSSSSVFSPVLPSTNIQLTSRAGYKKFEFQ